MSKDLEDIKKIYGEKFAHLCRTFFPSLLERDGLLFELITNRFEPNKELYQDIIDSGQEDFFKAYIFGLVDVEKEEKPLITKTPKQLLDEAGYILYDECLTEKDLQSFKKFYAADEKICTFFGGRLNHCRVWFAVKKDVEKIKRKNFSKPTRQDAYGTSVISIQFAKKGGDLSIKNRYNHAVNNPDATFSNNLDNIIPGLTDSFVNTYNLSIQSHQKFELPNYVFVSGRYYKYNFEANNIYFCQNNIIIDNFVVKKLDKSKCLLLDSFIIDKEHRRIINYAKKGNLGIDSRIKKITEERINNSLRNIIIEPFYGENIVITTDQANTIIKYHNPNLKVVGKNFLCNNRCLKEISLPNATAVEEGFLTSNRKIEEVSLPKLTTIGDSFLGNSENLMKISLPETTVIGKNFLINSKKLKEINLPNIAAIGKDFLANNKCLTKINFPKVISIEDGFLNSNSVIKEVSLPNAKTIGDNFLTHNSVITEIFFPEVTTIGDYFLYFNSSLKKLSLPKVVEIGEDFIFSTKRLAEISMPKVNSIGRGFSPKNRGANERIAKTIEKSAREQVQEFVIL